MHLKWKLLKTQNIQTSQQDLKQMMGNWTVGLFLFLNAVFISWTEFVAKAGTKTQDGLMQTNAPL